MGTPTRICVRLVCEVFTDRLKIVTIEEPCSMAKSYRVLFGARSTPLSVMGLVRQLGAAGTVKLSSPIQLRGLVLPTTVASQEVFRGAAGTVKSSRSLSLYCIQQQLSQQQQQQQQQQHAYGTSANGNGSQVPHFRRSTVRHPLADQISSLEREDPQSYTLPHPVWSQKELEAVEITHTPPEKAVDTAAYYAVQTLRTVFDIFSGYSWGKVFGTLDEKKWLTRIIYLETVAGVPGMIGAMVRHLKSLRRMTRDHGWIHTLLEEAENERMHLLTALELRSPGPLFKAGVIGTQAVFVTMFWVAYFLSPRFCHKFVGYLEEEAVKTYTHCLQCIDEGTLKMWAQLKAPAIAVTYWKLPEGAMMRDTILAIRADEAHHRVVNHTLGSIKPTESNPYGPGR